MSAVPAILPRNVCIDCGKCFLHQVTFQTGECTCERSKSPPQLPGNGVIITSDAKLKFVQSIRHPIFASCLIKMQTRISACQSHAKKIRDAGKVYEEDASGSAKPLALPTVASISNSQPIAAWPQNVAVDNALQLIANDPQAPVDNSSQLPAIDSEDYPFDLDDFDHPRHDPVPELQDLPQTKQPLFFPLRNSSSFNESPQFRESDGPHWFGNTTRVGERYQASAPTSCFDSSCPSEQSDHRHLKRQISNENEPRFGKKINLDDEGFEKAASCEIMVPVVAVDDATGKDIQSISMFTKLTRLTSLNKASFIRLVTDSKPAWSNLLFKIAFRDTKAAAKQEIEDDGLAFVLRVKVKAVKGVFQFPNGFSFVVFLSKGSSSSASAQPATHRRDILDKLAGHPHTRNDSLGQLKELYVGTCQVKDNHGDHSNGCFRRNGYHLLLSEDKHLRPWARILTAGNDPHVTLNTPPNYACFDMKNAYLLQQERLGTGLSTLEPPSARPSVKGTLSQASTGSNVRTVTITVVWSSGRFFKLVSQHAISQSCSIRSILEMEAPEFLSAVAEKPDVRIIWKLGSIGVSFEGALWARFDQDHLEIEGTQVQRRVFDLS